VHDSDSVLPLPVATDAAPSPSFARLPRWLAGLQAAMVSGLPTQILILSAVALIVRRPLLDDSGRVPLVVFATIGLADTALIVALVVYFLRQSGESPRRVLFGNVPAWPDIRRGLLLVPVAFLTVTCIVLAVRTALPWMQTVPDNPLVAYLDTPVQAALFLVVAVVAGGVREELQRAFILHRFEQRLGGIRLGLVVFTIAFAAQHVEQGADVALSIGLLALWWGLVYMRRRSVWLPMANHAGFNGLQVLQAVAAKALGAQ